MAGLKKNDIDQVLDSIQAGRSLGGKDPLEYLDSIKASNKREYVIELISDRIEKLDCLPQETKETERLLKALSKLDVTDKELAKSFTSNALRNSVKGDLELIDATRKARQDTLNQLMLGKKVEINSGAILVKGEKAKSK